MENKYIKKNKEELEEKLAKIQYKVTKKVLLNHLLIINIGIFRRRIICRYYYW